MKRFMLSISAVLICGAVLIPQAIAQPAGDPVARGKYIVSTSGCHDCHTPWVLGPKGPGPDMTRALSGHPNDMAMPPAPKLAGPWLVSIAATNTSARRQKHC